MALLPICGRSFMCEDYNTYRAHPWSPFPLRRAHSGPGAHSINFTHLILGLDVRRGDSCEHGTCKRVTALTLTAPILRES